MVKTLDQRLAELEQKVERLEQALKEKNTNSRKRSVKKDKED